MIRLKSCRFGYIILVCLLLGACAKSSPWQVVKYNTAGEKIALKPLLEGTQASWSPDGKWIAYVDSGIWIADPQGVQKVQLTSRGQAPSWSPGGKRLAYADSGIWVLELESREKKQLTQEGYDPCWSADGQHIIYAAKGIWSIDTNAEKPEQLMPEGIDPGCSPLDERILVEIFDPQRLEFDIFSGKPHQKPQLLVANAESPAWSPDGKYVLYCSTGIWVMAADGSKPQRLTVYGYQPAWSPDGDKILFSFKDKVWLMDSPYKE
jgi:Tol biopolymer transport system component